MCYNSLGLKPEYVAASSARKLSGIKIEKGKKAKEQVLKFVLDNVDAFGVEYTSRGNPKPGTADRADSWVVAKAGLEKWKEKNLIS